MALRELLHGQKQPPTISIDFFQVALSDKDVFNIFIEGGSEVQETHSIISST